MPKLSTKITVKLEPDLLDDLQLTAESEGKTISECVREAVIKYIQEQREKSQPQVLRLNLSRYERNLLDELLEVGIVDSAEDLFHRTFDDFITGEGLRRYLDAIKLIKGTRPLISKPAPVPNSHYFASGSEPSESDNDKIGDEKGKEES